MKSDRIGNPSNKNNFEWYRLTFSHYWWSYTRRPQLTELLSLQYHTFPFRLGRSSKNSNLLFSLFYWIEDLVAEKQFGMNYLCHAKMCCYEPVQYYYRLCQKYGHSIKSEILTLNWYRNLLQSSQQAKWIWFNMASLALRRLRCMLRIWILFKV